VGIIIIDNYDDLMQSLEDTIRTQILAEIDAKITRWMGYTNGILKKFERDKYTHFDYKYLKDFEEKSLTSWIRQGNKCGEQDSRYAEYWNRCRTDSLLEKFRFARASLDIALGRGGDQVVVKNGEIYLSSRKDQGAGEKNES